MAHRKAWKRHEESTHLPRQTWTCLVTGPRITAPDSPLPTTPRSATRPARTTRTPRARVDECRAPEDRTFVCKDGLAQRLNPFHFKQLRGDGVAAWSAKAPLRERIRMCGFCGARLEGWAAHISQHFRGGVTMKRWRFESE